LRLISHRTDFLRLFAFERIELRSDEGLRFSYERSKSGQKSIICLTVWLGYPQEQFGVTFGTRCRARNALNPIFPVRSCVARELSALRRLLCRWRSFRALSQTRAATLLSGGTLFLCFTQLLAHWWWIALLICVRGVVFCPWGFVRRSLWYHLRFWAPGVVGWRRYRPLLP
jgi:hypothetical protein